MENVQIFCSPVRTIPLLPSQYSLKMVQQLKNEWSIGLRAGSRRVVVNCYAGQIRRDN